MKIDQALQNGGETAVCSGGKGILVENDHDSLVAASFEKILEGRLVVGKDSSLGFAQTKLDGTAQIPNVDGIVGLETHEVHGLLMLDKTT